jgi:hypothetical protein
MIRLLNTNTSLILRHIQVHGRSEEEKPSNPTLITLHLLQPTSRSCSCLFKPSADFKPTDLIQELYKDFLKKDPLFHFLYEPDLIIRISVAPVLEQIKKFLTERRINFTTYAYPHPERSNNGERRYGEDRGGVVAEHLHELFLPAFHTNSIAALILPEDRQLGYMERTSHTYFNMLNFSHEDEATNMLYLATRRSSATVERLMKDEKVETTPKP